MLNVYNLYIEIKNNFLFSYSKPVTLISYVLISLLVAIIAEIVNGNYSKYLRHGMAPHISATKEFDKIFQKSM